MDFSSQNTAVYTPHQIWHWFTPNRYLQIASEHKPTQAEDFSDKYSNEKSLALPELIDHNRQDVAEKNGLEAAIELCNDFDNKSDEWEETIRDAEEDAETLQTLTTSMGNVNAPHAYTAGVEGSITDAPSLSDDNFERMPKNEKKKCQLYRDNNIKSTDCPFTLNGSKKDVKIKMYSMMLEARIGNKVENLKKGTKLPEEFRSKDQAELDFMNSSFDGGQLKEEDMPIGFTIPVVVSSSSSSSNNTNNNNGTTTSSSTTTPSSSSSSTLPTAASSGDLQNETSKPRMTVEAAQQLQKLKEAAKILGGRAQLYSDNAPALIWSCFRDSRIANLACTVFSGGFHMLKKVLHSTGSLFEHFMDEMVRPFRAAAAAVEYYKKGSDPRQRWWAEPWFAMGVRMAMVQGYRAHLKSTTSTTSTTSSTTSVSSTTSTTSATTSNDSSSSSTEHTSSSSSSSSPPVAANGTENAEWRNVLDYVHELAQTRPSLFPVLFWLRSCDLANMLRACGKKHPQGDFELYRQLNRLSLTLFATTNSMKYIRVMLDNRVYLDTCSKFDYLLAKYIAFVGRTAKGNACFRDELQEKFVQVCRILSGGGANGKNYNAHVEGKMRENVINADELLWDIQTCLEEMDATIDAKDVVDAATDENATDAYEGETADRDREHSEEAAYTKDKWRRTPIDKRLIRGLQMALRGGWFDANESFFCDCRGRIIKKNSFVSLVNSDKMNLDVLAEPSIGNERVIQYVKDAFGPWPTQDEKEERESKISTWHSQRSMRSVRKPCPKALSTGPVMNSEGFFTGTLVRSGDTKLFNRVPRYDKTIDQQKEIYAIRKTTTESRTIMRNSFFIPSVKMKLFTAETLMQEIQRVKLDWGKDVRYSAIIKNILPNNPLIKEGGSAKDSGRSKKELKDYLIALRMKKVPISKFLKADTPNISVRWNASQNRYERKMSDSNTYILFNYCDQPFIKNNLRGEDASTPSILRPVVLETNEHQEQKEEEEEEVEQKQWRGEELLQYLKEHQLD